MSARKGTSLLLMLVTGLLLSAFVMPGCSREQRVIVQPQAAAPAPQPATSTRASGPTIVRQAERDYYVDSRGALHLITRHEAVSGGGLYYIEGDERGWYLDESGRLYYREPAGRIIFYEEAYPARSGVAGYGYSQSGMSSADCESQWRNCVAGCEAISPRQRYDRPNCLRNCDAIRDGCLGR